MASTQVAAQLFSTACYLVHSLSYLHAVRLRLLLCDFVSATKVSYPDIGEKRKYAYRNNLSLLHTGLSGSSIISSTLKLFFKSFTK